VVALAGCEPAAKHGPDQAPTSKADRATRDSVADRLPSPAQAKPTNTTLPVMLAKKTRRVPGSSALDQRQLVGTLPAAGKQHGRSVADAAPDGAAGRQAC
jgi:hypothetical protein